jgi:hypothetical protein
MAVLAEARIMDLRVLVDKSLLGHRLEVSFSTQEAQCRGGKTIKVQVAELCILPESAAAAAFSKVRGIPEQIIEVKNEKLEPYTQEFGRVDLENIFRTIDGACKAKGCRRGTACRNW